MRCFSLTIAACRFVEEERLCQAPLQSATPSACDLACRGHCCLSHSLRLRCCLLSSSIGASCSICMNQIHHPGFVDMPSARRVHTYSASRSLRTTCHPLDPLPLLDVFFLLSQATRASSSHAPLRAPCRQSFRDSSVEIALACRSELHLLSDCDYFLSPRGIQLTTAITEATKRRSLLV